MNSHAATGEMRRAVNNPFGRVLNTSGRGLSLVSLHSQETLHVPSNLPAIPHESSLLSFPDAATR